MSPLVSSVFFQVDDFIRLNSRALDEFYRRAAIDQQYADGVVEGAKTTLETSGEDWVEKTKKLRDEVKKSLSDLETKVNGHSALVTSVVYHLPHSFRV
jgi:hypothetical protein